MALNKYNFIAGDILPAENVNSIDPDNPVAQSPAQLIGGTDVSFNNFVNLKEGDNDGAFKATIDGVVYDDVAVNSAYTGEISDLKNLGATISSQNFSINKKYKIKNINVNTGWGSSGQSYKIVIRKNNISGEIVAESETKVVNINSGYEFNFIGNNIVDYDYGQQYYLQWVNVSGGSYTDFGQINSVNGYEYNVISNISDIAKSVQTAIRARTSKLETVVWDTDHFEITSTILGKNNGSQVLRLQPPTTGTDISGAGYLDLGANATEVASDGDDYRLVRLDSNGQIPNGVSASMFNNINTTAKSLNTVYQNTTDKNKLVIASIYFHITIGADVTSVGQIGETNNPTTVVSTARIKGSSYPDSGTIPVFMLVKPGWYYRVSGGASVASWFECDLI